MIPARPDLLLKVQTILSGAEPDPVLMAELIKQDVALYTSLLAIVNSPLFRRTQRINSVEHAVSVLGMPRVGALIQSMALRSALDADGHWQAFWDSATEVALLCQCLVDRFPHMNADHAYTLGMMHDIGSAVMRMNYPDYQQWALAQANANAAQTRKAERERYGTDRFELAGRLAHGWFMPDSVATALAFQAHAQASLMGKAQVSDDVKNANALLILAKDISGEYHRYWNFANRVSLDRLLVRTLDHLSLPEHEYLDIKEDLVERLATSELVTNRSL
ncbi:MAG: HDOD domain-containing protein [Saccharospirillaceae bacterium]|nr:HDOD domain-containing protein [Saccharospirillaceae bacterium]MCD8530443.1 HDOD domain-containing protein [Saccharospirillaceae bacterium]